MKRLAVALVLVPLLYLYVMYLPAEYYLFLLIFVSTGALAEFYAICRVPALLRFAGLAGGVALLAALFLKPHLFVPLLLFCVLAVTSLRLFQKRDAAGSINDVAPVVLGLLYVPGLLSFQLDIVRNNPAWLVMLFAAIWGADSMAYYVGTGIGKRKLYPEISPKKTVEGAVGSLAGGIIGAGLIRFTLLGHVTIGQAVLLGLVVAAASVAGDLVESMFKRDAGVKDSGTIMPGHGGLLDKVDSATFAGPAFYWCCVWLGLMR
ncbi:MAG: phosphatidate cytidylyltransferase [Thermodesulfovibrionales bacterium]